MEAILGVTRALAAPFDLATLLAEVVRAAKQVLSADWGSVWLYEAGADELVLAVAREIRPVRVKAGVGLVGACASERRIINVPNCNADPRFASGGDEASGYRTRCVLMLPLVDHEDVLVGVMQVQNKSGGVFDADDEVLGAALAAQCAVALQRARTTEALIEGVKVRQELDTARVVQMSTPPVTMPSVPGYDVYGTLRPAERGGGNTFDLSVHPTGLAVVLGDATGRGIGPALSVTRMQAMLRMAFRLGADLETAFTQVNNQLAETLADDRYITAFIGLLDPATHRMRFHSGGQEPILHFQAASGSCARHRPTSIPLGAMRLSSLRPAVDLDLRPGDILILLSDGVYECRDAGGEAFGEGRVEAIVREHRDTSMSELSAILLDEVKAFARGAPQEDDITMVLVKRNAAATARRAFARSYESIQRIFAFTAEVFSREEVDPGLLRTVDLALEELFTNMVKYNTTTDAAVQIEIAKVDGGVEVTLTDYDVEPFDVTRTPEVDITLPIEKRRPGGLGLHLIRKLLDSVEYEYSTKTRQSRITFRKTATGAPTPGGTPDTGGDNARD
jgi:sigma-B regulation protein RsbU (phosphoserine phosphatase)